MTKFLDVAAMNIWKWFFVVFPLLFYIPLAASGGSDTGPLKELTLDAGRSFGHTVGDLIRHEIRFSLDKPYQLENSSLPRPGPLDKWLELREIKVTSSEEDSRTFYSIEVLYQIFPSVRESETRPVPGLSLQTYDGNRSLIFETPGTWMTVAPLIPGHIPDAGVNIRPAIRPAPIPLEAHWRILGMYCAAFTAVLGYLAWRRGLLPFLQPASSPFASARRKLRRARNAQPASPEYRKALLAIHQAFNETAGETLYANGLERFFHDHPAFAPMRQKTGIFFTLSQQVFFTQSTTLESTKYPLPWLERFCREYCNIERTH